MPGALPGTEQVLSNCLLCKDSNYLNECIDEQGRTVGGNLVCKETSLKFGVFCWFGNARQGENLIVLSNTYPLSLTWNYTQDTGACHSGISDPHSHSYRFFFLVSGSQISFWSTDFKSPAFYRKMAPSMSTMDQLPQTWFPVIIFFFPFLSFIVQRQPWCGHGLFCGLFDTIKMRREVVLKW